MGRLGTGYSCLLYPLSLISVVQYVCFFHRGPKYACQLSADSYTRVPFKRLPLYAFLPKFLELTCRAPFDFKQEQSLLQAKRTPQGFGHYASYRRIFSESLDIFGHVGLTSFLNNVALWLTLNQKFKSNCNNKALNKKHQTPDLIKSTTIIPGLLFRSYTKCTCINTKHNKHLCGTVLFMIEKHLN